MISILSPLFSFNFLYSSSLKFIICTSILNVPSVIDPHPIFLLNLLLNIVPKFVLMYASKTVKNIENVIIWNYIILLFVSIIVITRIIIVIILIILIVFIVCVIVRLHKTY